MQNYLLASLYNLEDSAPKRLSLPVKFKVFSQPINSIKEKSKLDNRGLVS